MAEKKSVGHAYNIDFLNVWFAASSVLLFVAVIWMVWDDFDREWKNTQRRFAQLEYQVTRASLQQAARSVDRGKLGELQGVRTAARRNVAANQAKVAELTARLAQINGRLYRENQDFQFTKATYDVDRYAFEVARAAGDPRAQTMGEGVAALEQRMTELALIVETSNAERAGINKELDEYTGRIETVQKELDALTADFGRLRKLAAVQAPSAVKDYFRNAPLLDFMAPTLKVQQVITPNIVDDVNFTKVPKMDRCQTCHLAIDKKGYEKYPQPYTTHPNLSSYLGSDSAHPLDQVGCTVCHEGMGASVSFRDTHHTPKDEKQKEEWEHTYGWEEPHEWDLPMLPVANTEASCAKCHKQEIYLPKADKLNIAYATYERAGCYACHKTRGFEDLRKPGPILTKIDAKLTPDWVRTWLRNPKAVKASTWMPRVWYNSNSNSPEDAVRNEVEINAAAAYLFANASTHDFAVKNPPRGDAKRGEELVKAVGCLGCHVVDEKSRDAVNPRRTFGQPLQNIGAKTTYEWLFDWVRDPKHYNDATYMPDLRLTDPQVADVATYLSGLKAGGGDPAKATPDQQAVDAVYLDYLKAVMPTEAAKAEAAKLDPHAKQIALGQRVIDRYGCFSCHEIKGFEKTQPIGVDLSEEGSKLVARLDFALVTGLSHADKLAWFRAKLQNPRVFDQGRVLRWDEKLRMPNFELSDQEVDNLITAVMSFQREIQPSQAMPTRSARRDYLTRGRALVHRRNCVGCHQIETSGGDLVQLMPDPSLGPPLLTPTGARVQPDWLYAFLRGPIPIRPWLTLKMPTFGLQDPEMNGIIRYFGSVSNTMGPFRTPQVVRTAASDQDGKALFETLKCQQCHVLGAIPKDQPTANLAPDLRMAPDRLQPDWIVEWLKNPASIVPGTRMPGFWPEYPKSPYPHAGANGEAQINAIVGYLQGFRGGPTPRVTGAAATKAAND